MEMALAAALAVPTCAGATSSSAKSRVRAPAGLAGASGECVRGGLVQQVAGVTPTSARGRPAFASKPSASVVRVSKGADAALTYAGEAEKPPFVRPGDVFFFDLLQYEAQHGPVTLDPKDEEQPPQVSSDESDVESVLEESPFAEEEAAPYEEKFLDSAVSNGVAETSSISATDSSSPGTAETVQDDLNAGAFDEDPRAQESEDEPGDLEVPGESILSSEGLPSVTEQLPGLEDQLTGLGSEEKDVVAPDGDSTSEPVLEEVYGAVEASFESPAAVTSVETSSQEETDVQQEERSTEEEISDGLGTEDEGILRHGGVDFATEPSTLGLLTEEKPQDLKSVVAPAEQGDRPSSQNAPAATSPSPPPAVMEVQQDAESEPGKSLETVNPCKVYVAGIPFDLMGQELKDTLTELFGRYGTVKEVQIVPFRTTDGKVAKGRHRGIAFVEMETAEEAKAAIDNLNQKPNLGRILMVREAVVTPPKTPRTQILAKPVGYQLYVGNLDKVVTSQDLVVAFQDHGTVIMSKVITDYNTGESRGFGFVSFATEEEARQAATAMNGSQLGSSIIKVNMG